MQQVIAQSVRMRFTSLSEECMNDRGSRGWEYDSRTSKEYKRDWLDSRINQLVAAGHSKQFARAKAKQMWRGLSR